MPTPQAPHRPSLFAHSVTVLLLGLLALGMAWSARCATWWRLLALQWVAYALGIVLFTQQVNLPLNYLTESWTPSTLPPDWASVRDAWNLANLWRSGLCLVLFAAGLLTLVLRLQATPASGRQGLAGLALQ